VINLPLKIPKGYLEWLGRLGITDDYIDNLLEENDDDEEEVLKIIEEEFIKKELNGGFWDGRRHDRVNVDNFPAQRIFKDYLSEDILSYVNSRVFPVDNIEEKTRNTVNNKLNVTFEINNNHDVTLYGRRIGRVNKIGNSKTWITRYKNMGLDKIKPSQLAMLGVHMENIGNNRTKLEKNEIKKYLKFTPRQLHQINNRDLKTELKGFRKKRKSV
jgi:hypothetical protein